MNVIKVGSGLLGGLGVIVALCLAVAAVGACGVQTPDWSDGGTGSTGCGLLCAPAGGSSSSGGAIRPSDTMATTPASGGINAPDCSGCTFPAAGAPSCGSAPAIKIVYPNDNALVPPNLNVISVQWTPFNTAFKTFEVDFSQSLQPPNTDWRIVTACKTQTVDAQSGTPSGGCELVVDPLSWSKLVAANRGLSNPLTITVRGTTDGKCASTSASAVHLSIAEEDLIGTYYYWKSTVTTMGVGGQIWSKGFGDLAVAEKNVTSTVTLRGGTLNATCNGCHALSRDGKRMVVYSDDADSDDEYSDIGGSLLDMTTTPATAVGVAVDANRMGGQPPGFSTLNPLGSFYVTSNGMPIAAGNTKTTTSAGYPAAVPANGWSEWNGQTGTFGGPVTIGDPTSRPTMPDWSIDGTSVVYVQPGASALWDQNGSPNLAFMGSREDDAHIFSGSLYTVPYVGNGAFGAPAVFLKSGGENNYYPSYSPDQPMSYVIFNRAPLDMSAGSLTGCNGTAPQAVCPNDSFSNPAARLMLMQNAANSTPIDLERANGTPASGALPWSNSYPRWAPFVQNYHGNKLLWFTFSSTRDYGVRVLNHKTGMYQCYPADALQTPGGAHREAFASECQEPQLWMAPLTFTEAQGATADPSGVAFWLPYQDVTTHNHTAQWTQQVSNAPPPPPGCLCVGAGKACASSTCGCCAGLTCGGGGVCIAAIQ